MRSDSVFGLDVALLLATLSLVVIGVLFIFSSGITVSGLIFSNEYIKQIVWAVSGLGLMIVVAVLDYDRLRSLIPYFYGLSLLLLLGTLVFGKIVNGSKSWLGIGDLGIQPSEFAKLATILFLANVLEKRHRQAGEVSTLLLAAAVVLLPVGLVLLQPDLGTALVFLPIFFFMTFAAGTRILYLLFLIITAGLLVFFTFVPVWEYYIVGRQLPLLAIFRNTTLLNVILGTFAVLALLGGIGYRVTKKRYFFWIAFVALATVLALAGSLAARKILKEYQLMRLVVFLNPQVDPRGAGWNIIQSVTAVGSGGFSGKGFLQGTQSHLRYLPQQSTDFIFSILAEEWGFIGCLAVFLLFFAVLYRGLVVTSLAKDGFASFASAGITGMIFFHLIVNVGMAMGIMPVTGIPLFFLSYGGSSLWTVLLSVGFLMSFYIHRYRY